MNIKPILFLVLLFASKLSYAQVFTFNFTWWGQSFYITDYTYNYCIDYDELWGFCSLYADPMTKANDAATYINAYTDVYGGMGPNGEGQVFIYTTYLGPNTWSAFAMPYTAGGTVACGDFDSGEITNSCNTTNMRADSGILFLNDYYFDDSYSWGGGVLFTVLLDEVFIHEMGHFLGLAHNQATSDSVMHHFPLSGKRFIQDELDWINTTY